MIKYLLLLAGAYVLWRFWFRRETDAPVPPSADSGESMVRCAQCGVYLPETDALAADGRHYCNEAHRRAARPSQT